MKRILDLLRVSSKKQLKAGDDIPLQRAECMEYIESKKVDGWVHCCELIEKGVSAFKNDVAKRDKLNEIIKMAEKKEFDILLVYMSDRIARKSYQGPAYLEQLHNLGIEIWTVKEGKLELDTQEQRLILYMKFWAAEGESIKTSGRVNDAQINRLKEGKHVGGYAPYGYELVRTGEFDAKDRALKELVIVPEQAEIAKKIFCYFVIDGLGSYKIAQLLNQQGVKPVKTDEWGSSTITSILKNPIYKGFFAYNRRKSQKRQAEEDWIFSKEQREDLVIIPELVWEKAQTIRKSRNYNKSDKDRGITTGSLILMGFTFCGYCGTKLTNASRYDYWTTKDGVKHKKITGKYKCTNKANGKLNCQGRFVYSQDDLEKAVVEEIHMYLDKLKTADIYNEIMNEQKKEREREKKELDAFIKKISSIKKDIETLEEQVPAAIRGEYVFSIDKLSQLIHNKENELTETEKELLSRKQELEKSNLGGKEMEEFTKLLPNWREEFEMATSSQKQLMLSDIIERVDVFHDKVHIKIKIKYESLFTMKNDGFDTTQYKPCSG